MGLSQLRKLTDFLERRREISRHYEHAFSDIPEIEPLKVQADVLHAYHLYVVRVNFRSLVCDRTDIFQRMRDKGVRLNVHYIPVHLHPFYKERYGTRRGLCPVAEEAYEKILSLPMYPEMDKETTEKVISLILQVITDGKD